MSLTTDFPIRPRGLLIATLLTGFAVPGCTEEFRPPPIEGGALRGFFGVPEYGTELLYRIDGATSAQEVKAVQVIERRLRHYGLRDTEVRAVGSDQILLKCPHGDDLKAIKSLLSQQGYFRLSLVVTKQSAFLKDIQLAAGVSLVPEPPDPTDVNSAGGYFLVSDAREALEEFTASLPLPPKTRMAVGRSTDGMSWRTWLLSTEHVIEEPKTKEVRPEVDRDFPQPLIHVALEDYDADRFAELTRFAVKRRLALEIDDFVYAAPIVQEPITEGRLVVNLSQVGSALRDTMLHAHFMAAMIREGGIPKPVQLVEERLYGEHPED